MRKYSTFFLIILTILISGCQKNGRKEKSHSKTSTSKTVSLEEIRKEGKLRVLTIYSGTSYFLYRGQPMGFEYELLKRFADHLGVELDIEIAQNIDHLLTGLEKDAIDLVAYGITVTSDRKEKVNFTDYLHLTHQVLVQKKPDNWRKMKWSEIESALIHDAIELIGDTVSVRKNSSYHKRLVNLSKEIGGEIVIDTLSGNLS